MLEFGRTNSNYTVANKFPQTTGYVNSAMHTMPLFNGGEMYSPILGITITDEEVQLQVYFIAKASDASSKMPYVKIFRRNINRETGPEVIQQIINAIAKFCNVIRAELNRKDPYELSSVYPLPIQRSNIRIIDGTVYKLYNYNPKLRT